MPSAPTQGVYWFAPLGGGEALPVAPGVFLDNVPS